MRAKEYAQKWNAMKETDPSLEGYEKLRYFFIMFLDEFTDLIETRRATLRGSQADIINELEIKWEALSRLVPEIPRAFFLAELRESCSLGEYLALCRDGVDFSKLNKWEREGRFTLEEEKSNSKKEQD